MLIVRDSLDPADKWWVWVPVAGFVTGLFGLVYVPYVKHSRARAGERRRQRALADDHEGNGGSRG